MGFSIKRLAAIFVVLALLGGGIALSRALAFLDMPLSIKGEALVFELPAGSSFRAAAADLHSRGVLKWPRILILYARLTGEARQVHAGEYAVKAGTTPRQLLSLMTKGAVVQRRVTLIEGSTVAMAIDLVQQKDGIKATPGLTPAKLAAHFKLDNPDDNRMEGWLFPDTYNFPKGTSDLKLLTTAYRRMQEVLAEEWELRSQDLPYASPYEALIMASIVEKETGVPEERTRIAGVFVRRLQRKMRLQTDPTVIYGIGPGFDGNLRTRHLRDEANPYNTYRIPALPPTPIALPGREAIYAALHPAPGDSLYFVARGDGSHYFSKTLAEHTTAVKKYQIDQRRKQYRSAPR